ncbi:helicase associated domain-containing protein [Streptomyces virginiae]|uniref:helicase associated domain-containing protein n=1 Tax=Streptomyces virginiae TaxID=1961 RepID=UPI0036A6B069
MERLSKPGRITKASHSSCGKRHPKTDVEQCSETEPVPTQPADSTSTPSPQLYALRASEDPAAVPGPTARTVDWQRHYAYPAQLLAEGARLTAIVPGVTRHGEDVGPWVATQRHGWDRLNEEQQRQLDELGVKKAPERPQGPGEDGCGGLAGQRLCV